MSAPTAEEPAHGGVLWLAGEMGQGKTTLLRRLEAALGAAGRTCVYVPVPTLDAESLTIWCLAQLGLPQDGSLEELAQTSARALYVLVDDAEHLPAESAALLARLAGGGGASVWIVGTGSGPAPEALSPIAELSLGEDIGETLAQCLGAVGLSSVVAAPTPPQPAPRRAPRPELPPNRATRLRLEVDEEPPPSSRPRPAFPARPALVGLALLVLVFLGVLLLRTPGGDFRDEPGNEPASEDVATGPPPAPEPAAAPAVAPAPAPVPKPEPVAMPVPEPAPEPVAARAPEPAPEPVAARAPEPAPEPVAARAPEPAPEPVAARAPEPAATGVLAPVSAAAASRVSESAPVPERSVVAELAEPQIQPPPLTRVIVNAIPAALVTLDGQVIGSTPIPDLEVEPGLHRFRAEFQDGTAVERQVDVTGEVLLLLFP